MAVRNVKDKRNRIHRIHLTKYELINVNKRGGGESKIMPKVST